MTCSCRKRGLPCNLACKICEGLTCTNNERYSVKNVIAAEREREALDEDDVVLMNTSVDEEDHEQLFKNLIYSYVSKHLRYY